MWAEEVKRLSENFLAHRAYSPQRDGRPLLLAIEPLFGGSRRLEPAYPRRRSVLLGARNIDTHFRLLVGVEAGAGGDQVAQDNVLLQADQKIDFAGKGRFREHFRGLLETCGRDEAVRLY